MWSSPYSDVNYSVLNKPGSNKAGQKESSLASHISH